MPAVAKSLRYTREEVAGRLLADGPAPAPDTAGPASKCKSASLQPKQNWVAMIPFDPPILLVVVIISRACESPLGLSRCSGVSTGARASSLGVAVKVSLRLIPSLSLGEVAAVASIVSVEF